MLVIVNPAARGGTALARWRAVAPPVRTLVGPFAAVEAPTPDDARAAIREALAAGETRFVAAGGDGTVNLVAAALVRHAEPSGLRTLALGAIGLGSSNDFHKPVSAEQLVGGLPCRLDFRAPVLHDVGRAAYEDPAGRRHERFWILNASVGTTAEGNRLFNAPDGLLRFLKRFSTPAAMAYAAVRAIHAYRAPTATLMVDGEPLRVRVRNLGVVKNPHFTGMLRYDSPYEPSSGRFHAHLLEDVSLLRLAVTLAGLARGRFTGRPGTRSWSAGRVLVEADEPFPLELDGEVVMARRVAFSLIPNALRVCR